MDRLGRPAARDRSRPDLHGGVSLLVLSRREGESVVIPDCRVEIVVKEISAGFVRLGFKAPDDVDIYRDEIWKEMCFQDWNQRRPNDGTED